LQDRQDGHSERLRSLEVDDQLEFGRLLHREIAPRPGRLLLVTPASHAASLKAAATWLGRR
jgi:hypothetical protein